MTATPRVLITTPWPDAAVTAMQEHFEVEVHRDPLPMPEDKWLQALQDFDAIAPTVIDRIPPQAYVAQGRRTRIFGNFGVGFNHIDLDAAIATKYGGGCPGCGEVACICPDAEKP